MIAAVHEYPPDWGADLRSNVGLIDRVEHGICANDTIDRAARRRFHHHVSRWFLLRGTRRLLFAAACKQNQNGESSNLEELVQNGARRDPVPDWFGGARRTLCAFKH